MEKMRFILRIMILPPFFIGIIQQNYLNPFNPITIIRYSLSKQVLVTLRVYNAIGEELSTLVNETKLAGSYEVKFDATGFPSGVYYYQMKAGEYLHTSKMLLLK